MPLQFAKEWERNGTAELQASTLRDVIRGVHDVLLKASEVPGSVVEIVCSNLGSHLREILWHEATGSTFAQQLEGVLGNGGTVNMLVTQSAMEHGPVALSLVEQFYRFEKSNKVRINFRAPDAVIRKGFPHFTMSKLNREKQTAWYALVEWYKENQLPGTPERWALGSEIIAQLYGHTKSGDEVCRVLSQRFSELFQPANKSKVIL